MPIARKHLLPDPLFFRCIFSGRRLRRLAMKHPERVTAIVTQNGNAYVEGLSKECTKLAGMSVRRLQLLNYIEGYATAIRARTFLARTEFPISDSQDSACTEASNSDRHASTYSVPSISGKSGTPCVKCTSLASLRGSS